MPGKRWTDEEKEVLSLAMEESETDDVRGVAVAVGGTIGKCPESVIRKWKRMRGGKPEKNKEIAPIDFLGFLTVPRELSTISRYSEKSGKEVVEYILELRKEGHQIVDLPDKRMIYISPADMPDVPLVLEQTKAQPDSAKDVTKAYENTIKELRDRNDLLKRQLTLLMQRHQYHHHSYQGQTIKFGLLGDTQHGSLYENINFLNLAYDVYVQEKVTRVYHTGDMVDGQKMYRGHEFELHTIGVDAQADYAVDTYPCRDEIETFFISGNHDGAFWKQGGHDIGKQIANRREDMTYLGFDEADVTLESDEGEITLRIYHPGKGTAYAISYQPQSYINSLTGGEKPNILGIGHYHKMEYILYRNIHTFQTGCLQYQTPFMRKRHLAAIQGFWIVEVVLGDNEITRCKGEFFPCYI